MSRTSQKSRLDKKNVSGPTPISDISSTIAVEVQSSSNLNVQDWNKLEELASNHDFVNDFVRDILHKVDQQIDEFHVNKMLAPFTVKHASETILYLFDWLYMKRDEGKFPENFIYSVNDLVPSPMINDSLAQGCLPSVEMRDPQKEFKTIRNEIPVESIPELPIIFDKIETINEDKLNSSLIDVSYIINDIINSIEQLISNKDENQSFYTGVNEDAVNNLYNYSFDHVVTNMTDNTMIKELSYGNKEELNIFNESNICAKSNLVINVNKSEHEDFNKNYKLKFKRIAPSKLPQNFVATEFSIHTPPPKILPKFYNQNIKTRRVKSDLATQTLTHNLNDRQLPPALLDAILLSEGVSIKHGNQIKGKPSPDYDRQVKSATLTPIKRDRVDISELIQSRIKVIPPPIKYQCIPPIRNNAN